MMEEKINNPERCPRFSDCSINVCPLDEEMFLRNKLPEENFCPFRIKKKNKFQKGIKTLMPCRLLEFVPKSNLKMLNKRYQRRWREKNKDQNNN